jgi:hypothetical protein
MASAMIEGQTQKDDPLPFTYHPSNSIAKKALPATTKRRDCIMVEYIARRDYMQHVSRVGYMDYITM